jgi:hypothetical protein
MAPLARWFAALQRNATLAAQISFIGSDIADGAAPVLLAEPSSHVNWSEDALNLAPIGGAWVVADSLARPRRMPTCAGVPTDPNERRSLFPEMKETDHEQR